MTAATFYRGAAALPVAVPLLAALTLVALGGWAPPESALAGALKPVVVIGVVSAVPYALFVAAVLLWVRPTTTRQYHMLLWAGPAAVALGSATVLALVGVTNGAPGVLLDTAMFAGLALAVGYAYSLSIFVLFRAAKALGLVIEWPLPCPEVRQK